MEVELVRQTRHVDADDPDEDGMHSFFYEYDVLELRTGEFVALARSYTDTPEEVSLFAYRFEGAPVGLGDVRRCHLGEATAVAAFLRSAGYRSVQWGGGQAYVEMP